MPRPLLTTLIAFTISTTTHLTHSADDWRNIHTGLTIPDEGYCDQPYTVITNDGNWLCTMTTGTGHEGQGGQHIVSVISKDQGHTWEGPFDIEPATGTDPPPDQIDWQLLPDGDVGLKATDNGPVNAEQNIVVLSDGSLYCMYRTVTGHPYHAYSRDGGHTWTTPESATYTPAGRPMKTPRACPRIWKAKNGKYLFWFHNHSRIENAGFKHRNPVWISGGIERNGHIHWSQPEILFYDLDPNVRMSYPDLIEHDGRYWITEPQKTIARVHEVDAPLLKGIWRQGEATELDESDLVLDAGPGQLTIGSLDLPGKLDLQETAALTIQCRITLTQFEPGALLLDNRTEDGRGLALCVTDRQTIELLLDDGTASAAWDCDTNLLQPNKPHHINAIVDARPGIIMFVVDGQLCDGGTDRHQGWTWYDRDLADVIGTGQLSVIDANTTTIHSLRIHNRPLRVSEAIASRLPLAERHLAIGNPLGATDDSSAVRLPSSPTTSER